MIKIGVFLVFVLSHAVVGGEHNNVTPKRPTSHVIPFSSLKKIQKRHVWIRPRGYEAAYFRAMYRLNKQRSGGIQCQKKNLEKK